MRSKLYGLAAVMAAVVGSSAFAATAAMTADQVRRQVEQESGGKVIKIEPRKVDHLSAFAVTIMNPGGNDNGAFQIYTVVVNAENGTIVPENRQSQN